MKQETLHYGSKIEVSVVFTWKRNIHQNTEVKTCLTITH